MARRRKPTWHSTGRWCFTTTLPNGKRKTFYDRSGVRSGEKARAREWMEAALEAVEERHVSGGDYTLTDLRLIYMTWVEKQVETGLAARVTFDGHRKQLKHVVTAQVGGRPLGQVLARNLNTADVDALKRAWEGKSPTTIRNRLASLQAMLNWAARPVGDRVPERLIAVNPIVGMKMPVAVVSEGRYAPSSEVEAFLGFVEAWAAASKGESARFDRMTALMVRVVAETGCRPGELCRATWGHFDHGRRVILFKAMEHKTGRKTGRQRVVVLPRALADRIESLRADPSRHPAYLFTHRSHSLRVEFSAAERLAGSPWNSSSLSRRVKMLRDAAVQAGAITAGSGVERMHLYKLRHTKITDMIQQGTSIADVAGLVGNSPRMTEAVYLHHQLDHLTRIADEAAAKEKEYRKDHP